MLGISIYLGSEPIRNQEPYIRNMREKGFRSIFTSLHIPEEDPAMYKEQLQSLGKLATELEMELMADISPRSLEALGVDWEHADQLLSLGLSGLRIDYGIEEATIIDLSRKMRVALNASTITREALQRMKANGLRVEMVEAWHNYYPRPETGLGLTDFINKNNELKEEGLTIMAFIPGDAALRGPLHEKLPTLEKHRNLSPFAAFLELEKVAGVDKILIGDISINDSTLEQFMAYERDEIVLRAVPSQNEHAPAADKQLLERASETFTNRADNPRDCIRAAESRQYARFGEVAISPRNCVARPIGTITVDNENYLRYQGELQVTLTDLPADGKVNVIGHVTQADLALLPWIKGNQKFQIQWQQLEE